MDVLRFYVLELESLVDETFPVLVLLVCKEVLCEAIQYRWALNIFLEKLRIKWTLRKPHHAEFSSRLFWSILFLACIRI